MGGRRARFSGILLTNTVFNPLHTNYAYMRSYIQDPFRRPWKKDLRAWVLLSHLIVIYMK